MVSWNSDAYVGQWSGADSYNVGDLMPQVAVKHFFIDDPAWPAPGVPTSSWISCQMRDSLRGVGQCIPALITTWEGMKWLVGSTFSLTTQFGRRLQLALCQLVLLH